MVVRFLIIGFMIVSFLSCKNKLIEEETSVLVRLTKSENVEVYEDGKDLVIDIFNSELKTKKERDLSFTTIALFAFDKVSTSKERKILFSNGSSVVNFIEKDKGDSYSVINSEMRKVRKYYDSVKIFLDAVCEKDSSKIFSMLDNDMLSKVDRRYFVQSFIDSDICVNNVEYLVYGFTTEKLKKGNEMVSLYLNIDYTDKNSKQLMLNFSKVSRKMIGAEEI